MKKTIIPMLAFLLVAGGQAVCSPGMAAMNSFRVVSDGQVDIPIKKSSEQVVPAGAPRTPARIPMSAYYSAYAAGIVVTFRYDCGEVDAVIENLSTGSYYTYTFDSIDAALLPIDGDSGLWRVTFTLESGAEYVGDFEI